MKRAGDTRLLPDHPDIPQQCNWIPVESWQVISGSTLFSCWQNRLFWSTHFCLSPCHLGLSSVFLRSSPGNEVFRMCLQWSLNGSELYPVVYVSAWCPVPFCFGSIWSHSFRQENNTFQSFNFVPFPVLFSDTGRHFESVFDTTLK